MRSRFGNRPQTALVDNPASWRASLSRRPTSRFTRLTTRFGIVLSRLVSWSLQTCKMLAIPLRPIRGRITRNLVRRPNRTECVGSDNSGRRPASRLAQRPYDSPKGTAQRLGSTPLPSAHPDFRRAARNNTSRAHVDVFSPAAVSSIERSFCVSRILNSASRRSSSGFGGRPRGRLSIMEISVATRKSLSTDLKPLFLLLQ